MITNGKAGNYTATEYGLARSGMNFRMPENSIIDGVVVGPKSLAFGISAALGVQTTHSSHLVSCSWECKGNLLHLKNDLVLCRQGPDFDHASRKLARSPYLQANSFFRSSVKVEKRTFFPAPVSAPWHWGARVLEPVYTVCVHQPPPRAQPHTHAAAPMGVTPKKTVALVALGCPKNTVDAEVMLGDLSAQGFEIIDEAAEADCVIINTCAFVEEAKAESVDAIIEAAKLKASGRVRAVVVTGCLAQRYPSELAMEIPEVDTVVGFAHYGTLSATISRVLQDVDAKQQSAANANAGLGGADQSIGSVATTGDGAGRVIVGDATVPFRAEWDRRRLTPRHSAFLRVAEGCDHTCTFCAIPGFRGRFRSKPWDAVLDEATRLVSSGVKELNLIAEDTNQYGMDFGGRDGRRLADLLYALADLPDLRWIRILYAYPSYFSTALVSAIADIPKVCPYIDIPLQHIADPVLRAMNRPSQAHTMDLLHRLRDSIPELALRSTFISGFPGERDEDHAELVDFVRRFRFERLGVFSYSEEEGTAAFDMRSLMLPMEVRESRRDELMSIQQRISLDHARAQVGKHLSVMVDEVDTVDGSATGRTVWDAPDIDCTVTVSVDLSHSRVVAGDVVDVAITGSLHADLLGTLHS